MNDDHYGLEKVKERVLEFLAVRGLTKSGESPIICLVGPPGTGKTSIARSVARALDKNEVILMGFFSGDSVCYPLFFYVAVHVSHDFLNNFCNMHNNYDYGRKRKFWYNS